MMNKFSLAQEANGINDSRIIAEVKDDVTDSGGTLPHHHFSYKSVIGLPLTAKITAKSETSLTIGFRGVIDAIKVRPITPLFLRVGLWVC